jgi:cathepsin B
MKMSASVATVIVFLFSSLGFILSSHDLHDHTPIITKQYLEALKQNATFNVFDYHKHPFKNWSLLHLKKKLGLKTDNRTLREIPYGNITGLPEEFDSRKQWPDCIHPIRDQLQCGSCWAFSASEVLSDRFCIASEGKINVVLSPQDMVSCDIQDSGCDGGYMERSWLYIRDTGIVTDDCLPYTSGDGCSVKCPFTPTSGQCKKGKFLKYKAEYIYPHNSISSAKDSLFKYGPIEAGFDVYEDFMSYSGGIYKRTSDNLLGAHAVKVVGWGKDTDGTEYWIVANSWNNTWGENGFFRIAFGQCNFENDFYSGIPLISSHPTDPTEMITFLDFLE